MQVKELRTVAFTVAEVTEMIESLDAAKSLRHLSGNQRRQLQETRDDLAYALAEVDGDMVSVHVSIVVSALRCGMMTQQWLAKMLNDLS